MHSGGAFRPQIVKVGALSAPTQEILLKYSLDLPYIQIWKLSISPLRYDLVHYILLAIPDTLFFQPAFPFSDYCLKRRKVQSATDRPKKS